MFSSKNLASSSKLENKSRDLHENRLDGNKCSFCFSWSSSLVEGNFLGIFRHIALLPNLGSNHSSLCRCPFMPFISISGWPQILARPFHSELPSQRLTAAWSGWSMTLFVFSRYAKFKRNYLDVLLFSLRKLASSSNFKCMKYKVKCMEVI